MIRPATPLAILAAALAAGCATYKHPELSVAEVKLKEETEAGYVLEFILDTRNDNPEPLPLRDVRYSLDLNGRQVFHGVRSAQATLRRFGTQQIALPAAVAREAGAPTPTGTVDYVLRGDLSYITPGQIAQVLFDARVRRPRVSFREAGRLDLSPSAQPAAPAPSPAPPAAGGSPP